MTAQPRDADGRFGERIGSAAEVDLAETFTVEDNWGDNTDFQGGVRTPDVEWVFRNGQCLALAAELAETLGSNRLIVQLHEEDGEDLVWDEETDSPVLDEDGYEIAETITSIHHAYALSADGQTAYDIDGPITRERVLEGERGVEELSVDDAKLRYSGFMSEQNYEFARTFVSSVLH